MLVVTNTYPINTNGDPTKHCSYYERNGNDESDTMSEKCFFEKIEKKIKEEGYKKILLYIHGFNTSTEEVLKTTKVMQCRLNNEGNNILVIPFIWPAIHCSFLNSSFWNWWWDFGKGACAFGWYDNAQENAIHERSREALMGFFYKLKKNLGTKVNFNILAFSLGNLLLVSTIERIPCEKTRNTGEQCKLEEGKQKGEQLGKNFFDNIFMVAADVPEDTLYADDGDKVCKCNGNMLYGAKTGVHTGYISERTIVCYAKKDWALSQSRRWITSRRLGRLGVSDPGCLPRRNDEYGEYFSAGCSSISHLDPEENHHFYFTCQEMMEDISSLINKKGNPSKLKPNLNLTYISLSS